MAVIKFSYMLEHPSIPHYEYRLSGWYRENVTGADNQQERPSRRFRRNPQRPYAEHVRASGREDMVRPPWRHGELGGTRNDLAIPYWDVTKVPKVAKFLVG